MIKGIGSTILGLALLAGPGAAGAAGYPWRDHAAPYDFRFGNDFDTHQQTRLGSADTLAGFLYVHYTGETTSDDLAVAVHADCASAACAVGWTIDGAPASAMLVFHGADDHPLWLVDRADIPQPGAFAHFHWRGEHPAVGEEKPGYLLELRAAARFCFIHHATGASGTCRDRGGVAVVPGIDIATHVNIVASFPSPAP